MPDLWLKTGPCSGYANDHKKAHRNCDVKFFLNSTKTTSCEFIQTDAIQMIDYKLPEASPLAHAGDSLSRPRQFIGAAVLAQVI